jgi:two-component system LytT family response regulator
MVRATLSSLEQRLDPRAFLRVHRAALVNLQEVQEIRDDGGLSLVLSDGSVVAVSRSKRERVDSILRPRFRV